MEASSTPPEEGKQPEQQGVEGGPAPANEVTIEGDQGEQVATATGMVPDGQGGEAFRQSAPPASAQSGVPIEADRAAGVEPGQPGPQGPSGQAQVTETEGGSGSEPRGAQQ